MMNTYFFNQWVLWWNRIWTFLCYDCIFIVSSSTNRTARWKFPTQKIGVNIVEFPVSKKRWRLDRRIQRLNVIRIRDCNPSHHLYLLLFTMVVPEGANSLHKDKHYNRKSVVDFGISFFFSINVNSHFTGKMTLSCSMIVLQNRQRFDIWSWTWTLVLRKGCHGMYSPTSLWPWQRDRRNIKR